VAPLGHRATVRRVVVGVAGWALLLVGAVLFPLPGPGLLLLLAGMILLAREFAWAERGLERIRARAVLSAARGVRTRARAAWSVLVTSALAASGLLWVWAPPQPSWWLLPAWTWLPGGLLAGAGQLVSGLVTLGLVLWAYRRFHGRPADVADLAGAQRPVGRV
jgi:hypothetical protein